MIPEGEYFEIVAKASKLIAEAELDEMVANSNEADYANVRYFSAYWPLFEMGGVAFAPNGKSAVMVGLASKESAKERSKIENIHLMKEYRKTADPVYPGSAGSSYNDVFDFLSVRNVKRIGLAGYLDSIGICYFHLPYLRFLCVKTLD